MAPDSTRVDSTRLDLSLNLNLALLKREAQHPNASLHQPAQVPVVRGTGTRADGRLSGGRRNTREGTRREGGGKSGLGSDHLFSKVLQDNDSLGPLVQKILLSISTSSLNRNQLE
jgi:hypothetical protein